MALAFKISLGHEQPASHRDRSVGTDMALAFKNIISH